jgi:hypothetical protein
MKRGIFLILMLLLLVDLSDGAIGQAKFVSTHSNSKISHTSYLQHGSVKVDSSDSLSLPGCRNIFGPRQSQTVIQERQLAFVILTSCNKGSSGGIPR